MASRTGPCLGLFSRGVCVDLTSLFSSTCTAGIAAGDLFLLLKIPMIAIRMAVAATNKTMEILNDWKYPLPWGLELDVGSRPEGSGGRRGIKTGKGRQYEQCCSGSPLHAGRMGRSDTGDGATSQSVHGSPLAFIELTWKDGRTVGISARGYCAPVDVSSLKGLRVDCTQDWHP